MRRNYDFEVLASRFVDSYDRNRYSVSRLKEELLGLLFRLFEKELIEIESGKKNPLTGVLKIELDNFDGGNMYQELVRREEILSRNNELAEFERQYYLKFKYEEIPTDRDSYADERHFKLHITWNYQKYLEKMKREKNMQSKVLRKVMN